jgi:preprotein translocase subunit SecG
MLGFSIGVLTFVMVLDCLLLVLLVLIQLPKKEAGAGLAFGGSATDALFGAGSGNVLTKVTRYAATTFFILAFVLSILQAHWYHGPSNRFRRQVEAESKRPGTAPAGPMTSAVPATAPVNTNLQIVPPTTTNPPAVAPSNAAPAPQ